MFCAMVCPPHTLGQQLLNLHFLLSLLLTHESSFGSSEKEAAVSQRNQLWTEAIAGSALGPPTFVNFHTTQYQKYTL